MASFAVQQRMSGMLETTVVDASHDARSLLKGIETVYVQSMSHEEETKKREHDQRQQEEATQCARPTNRRARRGRAARAAPGARHA